MKMEFRAGNRGILTGWKEILPKNNGKVEISCQQILMEDASVFSLQWMVLPERLAQGVDSELLLEKYLTYIRQFSGSLIRPVKKPGAVEFRLIGTGTVLLGFQGPLRLPDENQDRISLGISGGLLVQPENSSRGELTFDCEPVDGGMKISLQLADYCPMILGGPTPHRVQKGFYRLTQALIHRLATVRFLARVYRDLAGGKPCFRIVRIRSSLGENI